MNEKNKVNLNLQCNLGDFIESHLYKAIALLRIFILFLTSLPKSFYRKRKTVSEEMCKNHHLSSIIHAFIYMG